MKSGSHKLFSSVINLQSTNASWEQNINSWYSYNIQSI